MCFIAFFAKDNKQKVKNHALTVVGKGIREGRISLLWLRN